MADRPPPEENQLELAPPNEPPRPPPPYVSGVYLPGNPATAAEATPPPP